MFVKLPKSSTGTRMDSRIIRPPIVGVPFFWSCPSSPRSRMVSPICFFCSQQIIRRPKIMAVRMATTLPAMARNEM